MEQLKEGINNWKLRLILSALLCIMGLSVLISMVMGLFVELSLFDRSLVAGAVVIAGIPAYLILSGLGTIDEHTITSFLNEFVAELKYDAELLTREEDELSEQEQSDRSELLTFLEEHPIHQLLPDTPIKQAYILMVLSWIGSLVIWYFG
jgi:hypothetical protein